MQSIVWLASYPKSGNTWLRALLCNYLFAQNTPIPINKLHTLGMGDSIVAAYEKVAKENFDFRSPHQTLALRSEVLQGIVNNKADLNFVKTHCINRSVNGNELMPIRFSKCAIYVVRNPLDAVVSYASHFQVEVDEAIDRFAHSSHVINGSNNSTIQFLGSWSEHVERWIKNKRFPVLTLRYEDLLLNTSTAFQNVIEFLNIPLEPQKLEKAIAYSSFDSLQEQEKKCGFIEQEHSNELFFRRGAKDQWKNALTKQQVQRIYQTHGAIMKKLDYLPS